MSEKRPWGSFTIISEQERNNFINEYFPDLQGKLYGNEVCKILNVEEDKKLSWQYHNRRSEEWYVIEGPARVYKSWDDHINQPIVLQKGHRITLEAGERHMLQGAAVVAEIWLHTDEHNLSDESDIVRVKDWYDR